MQSIASVAASLPFFGVTSTMVCDDEGVDAIIDDRHEKHCIVAKGHNTGTRQKINVMVNVSPSLPNFELRTRCCCGPLDVAGLVFTWTWSREIGQTRLTWNKTLSLFWTGTLLKSLLTLRK